MPCSGCGPDYALLGVTLPSLRAEGSASRESGHGSQADAPEGAAGSAAARRPGGPDAFRPTPGRKRCRRAGGPAAAAAAAVAAYITEG